VTDPDLPTVSVLIPAHNYERFVEESLRSALDQDYPADRLEIIVVDDGSTDRTAEVVKRIADSNPARIKLVQQSNSGQIATIARARAEATGELIAFLDADDVWLPDKTRKQVAVFLERPDVGLVFCDMTTVGANGEVLKTTVFDPGEPDMDPVRLYTRVLRTNIIYGGSSMYRADLLADDPPDTLESWDWWLAIQATQSFATGGMVVGFVPEPLALYREHGENMLLGAGGAKLVNLRRRQLRFQLWALRRLNLDPLSPAQLLDVWGGPEWFVMTAAQATGSYFQSLVSISEEERAEAEQLRGQAQSARDAGDLRTEARLLFRALAWAPYEPDGLSMLRDAATRAAAAEATPHPLQGSRAFVVLVDAEDLLAGDEMLLEYAAAMAGAQAATLAIDASRLDSERAVARLQELIARCGLADRDDLDMLAVIGSLDGAQRHRMLAAASARYVRVHDVGDSNATRLPAWTVDRLAELRRLADADGYSARR